MYIPIRVGYKTTGEKDMYMRSGTCNTCGQYSDIYLYKVKQKASFFFIPVISVTKGRFSLCNCCGATVPLPKKDYKEFGKSAMNNFKSGEVPQHIIERDCDPKVLKLGIKTLLLVLSIIFAFFMVLGVIASLMDIGTDGLFSDGSAFVFVLIMLLMLAAGVLPLCFAAKNYRKAKIMSKLYKKNKRDM